nr:hypothetical protein [uncultured Shinella sp.]
MFSAWIILVDVSDRKETEEYAERLAAIVTFSYDAIGSEGSRGHPSD